MNVNSNAYTFGFAGILVILVAAALASAATILKPFQDKNVEQEKMQNILSSIGVDKTRDEAAEVFDEYVVDKLVLSGGEVVEGMDAFGVVMEKEARRPNDERNAPLYIAEKDGETYYVIPLRGTGLWGPIWGYIALESDVNTIYGAVFDHKGETPGLGAEITTPAFTEQFKGKKILLDIGIHPGISGLNGLPFMDYTDPEKIDILLIRNNLRSICIVFKKSLLFKNI